MQKSSIEIAFSDEDHRSVPRVDFAALQPMDQGVKIVFFEAKHFTNKELRSENIPQVVSQIKKYARLLDEHGEKIKERYHQVCQNLRDLRGLDEKCPERHKIITRIADGSMKLDIDTNPRLVVFGYDRDQENGCVWQGHRRKLEEKLKEGTVLFRGSSRGFTRGISA